MSRELNLQGISLNRAGDTVSALATFLEAHALDPAEPKYLLSAANMALKLGKSSEALRAYDELLQPGLYRLTAAQAQMARAKREAARARAAPSAVSESAPAPRRTRVSDTPYSHHLCARRRNVLKRF